MTDLKTKTRRSASEVASDIWHRTLPDGSRIAEVPLTGGKFVTVDQADLDRLNALGMSPAWSLNSNGRGHHYVRAHAPSAFGVPSLVQVARVIMEPPPGHVIKYLDGDRLNLRRINLAAVRRTSRAKARERFFGDLPEAAPPEVSLAA
jgi:hypothetical protein